MKKKEYITEINIYSYINLLCNKYGHKYPVKLLLRVFWAVRFYSLIQWVVVMYMILDLKFE